MKPEITILHGDNREVMKTLADGSFHAIVTDPPYELGFMGKKWDSSGIAYDPLVWSEVLRVLKPGGYLLAFGGSRTYHRLACAIKDAGFEIRDMIEWIYGSGFPKSLDVSKALDKSAGATRKIVGKNSYASRRPQKEYNHEQKWGKTLSGSGSTLLTEPSSDSAKLWNGYGTALKPAHEPICVARKPLNGTVIENVLAHGTGALNIDGCRVTTNDVAEIGKPSWGGPMKRLSAAPGQIGKLVARTAPKNQGRFPANLIFDEAAARALDEQSGQLTSGKPCGIKKAHNKIFGYYEQGIPVTGFGDTGGASRFFYTAKASGADRGNTVRGALPLFGQAEEEFRNTHPTVKPLALMVYLLKLVCPMVAGVNARVLDPFCGSGTTAVACKQLGIDCTGIESEAEHIAIINERLVNGKT